MRLNDEVITSISETSKNLPASYSDFKNLFSILTENDQKELLAVIYLGRGDYDTWETALENAYPQKNIIDYLADKPDLSNYLLQGWSQVPFEEKITITNESLNRLDQAIKIIESIQTDLKNYLLTFREKPESVSSNFIRLSKIITEIRIAAKENPYLLRQSAWFDEKSKNMKFHFEYAINTWLEDHESITLNSYVDETPDEWVRSMLLDNLSHTLRMANLLKEAVLKHRLDLFDYTKP